MGDKLSRFERHIDVPELGLEGQKKIMAARVLIVGMGGLGCPAALYLAAGGIGCLGMVDDDTVSVSNLQRQVLYGDSDIGAAKVDAARQRLAAYAPHCTLETHNTRLAPTNAETLIQPYDLVLDCTDNFTARYLVNEWCYRLRKPLVSASVYHHEGQISTFRGWEDDRPCYQCLYPKSDKLDVVPHCTEDGIMGPVTGIFGTMQAAAAINELTGMGDTLAGWMFMFGTLTFDAQKLRLFKRTDCEICGSMKNMSGSYGNNAPRCEI